MKRRLIEGYWDCTYCGYKKNLGGMDKCPKCGKTRDKDTTFYLEGKYRYVSQKKAVTINWNPNWVCLHCDRLNSADDTKCLSCGAPRTGENLNYFENKEKERYEQNERQEGKERQESQQEDLRSLRISKINMEMLKYFFIGLLSLIFICGIVFLFIPKEKEITVSNVSWERSINVERYQTVKESDWNLPVGARLLYTKEEFSHYDKVIDHYETKTRMVEKESLVGYEEYVVSVKDLGNGHFEEVTDERPVYKKYYETETYQEPVYREVKVNKTKYYYEIDKWLYERTEKANGTNRETYWPDVVLAEDERVSSKSERYYLEGTDKKGEPVYYWMPYEQWVDVKIGKMVKLKVNGFGYAEFAE